MKIVISPQNTLGGLVLALLFMLVMGVPAVAQFSPYGDPPPIKVNWGNSMTDPGDIDEGPMCVLLDQNNTIYIHMKLFVADRKIQNLPPMYFKYEMQADGWVLDAGVTAALTPSNFTLFNAAASVYRADIIHPYPCSPLCPLPPPSADNGQGDFCFKLSITLVMETYPGSGAYVPYPVGDYPSIWPPYIFPPIGPGFVAQTVLERKRVCCYGGNNNTGLMCQPPSGIIDYNNDNSVDNAETPFYQLQENQAHDIFYVSKNPLSYNENVLVYPNPSSSNFTVEFHQSVPGTTTLECLDLQGRVLKTMKEYHGATGYYKSQFDAADLTPGVYYLRTSTPNYTNTVKLAKTGN